MKPVSFIVNGDKAQSQDWKRADLLAAELAESVSFPIEVIAYTTNARLAESLAHITFVNSKIPEISSFLKAVASASGDNLIFSTINNFLADNEGAVIRQASELTDFSVAAPFTTGLISSAIGLRHLRRVPYYVISKIFTSRNTQLVVDPAKAIIYANKKLSFLALSPAINGNLDSVIDNVVFTRPYRTIATNIVYIQKEKIKKKIDFRRAEKLRRRVKSVPFSFSMPTFIICRDRVEPLKKLVKWCEDEGLRTIILIDNNSSYPPLRKYLSQTPHEVVQLNSNVGHAAAWSMGIVEAYAADKPFIVTDPDILPVDGSHGAVKYFCELLTAHPERTKAGFGLKIDDLPSHYALKSQVIAWEKQFWISSVEPDVYDAEIDTTFAVYRQNTPYTLGPGLRTGGKYVARHEPWYTDSTKPSAEIRYYRQHANKTIGSWGVDSKDSADTYINNEYHQSASVGK